MDVGRLRGGKMVVWGGERASQGEARSIVPLPRPGPDPPKPDRPSSIRNNPPALSRHCPAQQASTLPKYWEPQIDVHHRFRGAALVRTLRAHQPRLSRPTIPVEILLRSMLPGSEPCEDARMGMRKDSWARDASLSSLSVVIFPKDATKADRTGHALSPKEAPCPHSPSRPPIPAGRSDHPSHAARSYNISELPVAEPVLWLRD